MRDLAERIERVYQRHPEGAAAAAPRVRGRARGQSWIAPRLGASVRSVQRWIQEGRLPRAQELLLERLEAEAGENGGPT